MTDQDQDLDFWKVWDAKELERQFAPIVWIASHKDKRKTYETHVNLSTVETKLARETVPCQLDVLYETHENELLDIYGMDLPPAAPTLFWVHGGYWRAGDRSWSANAVRNAHSWGARTIVIDYPLAPQAKLTEMCNSVCEALSLSMKMFPHSTFILSGHSAGSQLLLTLLHKIPGVRPLPNELKERVTGFFLLSAPYDMRPVIGVPSINKALQMRKEEVNDFSALLTMHKIHPGWISNKNLELFVGSGEYDPPALIQLGKFYSHLCKKQGLSVEMKLFKDDDHFTLVDNLADANSDVSKTLKSFLLRADERRKRAKL